MKQVCAFIFARGGSKGLPNKNILPLGGIPLIVHSINAARKCDQVKGIYVSTDSDIIAEVASDAGAHIIQRPSDLASDSSPEWLSWQHAISEVRSTGVAFDTFLSLPSTSPLRSADDINRCLDALQPGIDIVVTMTHARRSPWFNMVSMNESGTINLLLSDKNICRRQDAPECYDLTTVAYVAKPDFILSASSIWHGTVAGVLIPPERAIDIDSSFDLEMAQLIYQHNISTT